MAFLTLYPHYFHPVALFNKKEYPSSRELMKSIFFVTDEVFKFKFLMERLVDSGFDVNRVSFAAVSVFAALRSKPGDICVFCLNEGGRKPGETPLVVETFSTLIEANDKLRFFVFTGDTKYPQIENDDRVTSLGRLGECSIETLVMKIGRAAT
jgi:hypothetical protein